MNVSQEQTEAVNCTYDNYMDVPIQDAHGETDRDRQFMRQPQNVNSANRRMNKFQAFVGEEEDDDELENTKASRRSKLERRSTSKLDEADKLAKILSDKIGQKVNIKDLV